MWSFAWTGVVGLDTCRKNDTGAVVKSTDAGRNILEREGRLHRSLALEVRRSLGCSGRADVF